MKKLISIGLSISVMTTSVNATTEYISTEPINTDITSLDNSVVSETNNANSANEDLEVMNSYDFDDDCILAVINHKTSLQGIDFTPEDFDVIEVESIENLTTHLKDRKSLELTNIENFHQIVKITLAETGREQVLQAIERVETLEFIKCAEPNYRIPLESEALELFAENIASQTEISVLNTNSLTPNDPYFSQQYNLTKIQVPKAWDITTGSSSVKIGIIDSGIANHPDLTNNTKSNLKSGWDFFNGMATTSDDHFGHGTRMAGIIGAIGNNSQGISGICWDVSLVPLQVIDDSTNYYDFDATAIAIDYAADNGISIINCSFGGYPSTLPYAHAIDNYTGLIICAAGNESLNTDLTANRHYPSTYESDNIISVAATDQDDNLCTKSNYGATTVDLAAPGYNIYQTFADGSCQKYIGGYTSPAAAHVTGVAALLKSADSTLTTRQLKNAIMYGVDEISSLGAKCVTGGRLNAYESMRIVDNDMFIIDYHANGGSGKMIPTKVPYGVTTTTTSNAFFRDGYDFDCWYIQRDSDDKWRYRNPDDTSQTGWYTAGSQPSGWVKFPYSNGTTVSQTIDEVGGVVHFYAQWKKYYTVQYNANGGSGTMASTKVYYGNTTTTRTNTFTRSGYDFDCWYIKRSSDGKWRYQNADNTDSGWYTEGSQPSGWSKYRYDNGISVSKTINEAGGVVHFYAQWKQYFTVKYNANGGSGSMTNTKVYYGVQTNLRANTFTRSGYDFLYWYAHRESDNKWRYWNPNNTSETGWYTAGSQPSGWVKHPYYNAGWVIRVSSVPGDVVNLHAQWRKYFTVQYNANGGSGTMSPTKVPYGVTTTTTSNKFTRSGYDFDCWYVRRSSDGKWRYRDPDDSSQSGWYTEGSQPSGWVKFRYSNGTTVSQTVSNPGETVTFYAQWKKYFIVQYRPNGGTGTMEDTKVYYGVSTATRKNTFLYQGRWFKHWAIQRSSDDKWRYRNPDDTSQSGWYTRGSQPDGWEFFPYSDGTTVSKTVSNPGEIVTFYARWS